MVIQKPLGVLLEAYHGNPTKSLNTVESEARCFDKVQFIEEVQGTLAKVGPGQMQSNNYV